MITPGSANPLLAAGDVATQSISRSLRFNPDDTAYLSKTPSTNGSLTTWTWSGWVKLSSVAASASLWSASQSTGNEDMLYFDSNGYIGIYLNGTVDAILSTNAYFVDPTAWYHVMMVADTTQATAANRIKIYVNGVQYSLSGTMIAQNYNFAFWNKASVPHAIGRDNSGARYYWRGYMTEINFVNGQALTPASFGRTNSVTGIWEPIKYTGSYGTNGFYLNFADNSGATAATLGKDLSGNAYNWTPNNFSVATGINNDSLVDTPTPYGTDTGVGGQVRGNYCTLSSVDTYSNTLTNGNLDIACGVDQLTRATFGMSSGQWYCEVYVNSLGSSSHMGITTGLATNGWVGSNEGWSYSQNGSKYTNNTVSGVAYGASFTVGDTIGIAFDATAGNLTYYKNGVSQGVAFSGLTTGPYFISFGSNGSSFSVNFGQRPFTYAAPSGYKCLCSINLPEPTIYKGSSHMNTVLYTGTGASRSVTGVGFQPDLVWMKGRSGSTDHGLYDVIRGVQNDLATNTAGASTTQSTGLTAFGSDGFTIGSLGKLNTNAATYTSWNWKAGGSGVSNTSGSITSTVSANPTAGFSILTYTGTGATATVGHGLGVAPKMLIVKRRTSSVTSWVVYHASLGPTNYLLLEASDTSATSSIYWNNTAPTASVFTVGNASFVNQSASTHITYCFAEVAGYSKFGSYVGNGSADGPFVYLGFRPKYLMFKNVTSPLTKWYINDSARNSSNPNTYRLFANEATAEDSLYTMTNFLSNGFKVVSADIEWNSSDNTYIYAAFAEAPFKYSLAR